VGFWLAFDLQHLLSSVEWRNFTLAISKAKTACELSSHPISDHFVDVNKMVELGSKAICCLSADGSCTTVETHTKLICEQPLPNR
jgi:hypothetical protein